MTGPPVDWEKIRGVLASPGAASLPPEMKARMQQDLAQHDSSRSIGAQPGATQLGASPLPPEQAPSDMTTVSNPFVQVAQHELAKQVAIENTNGWVNKMGTIAMQPTILAMQFAHDMSLGLSPSPYGSASDPEVMDRITGGASIPIRIVSGIASMMLQGDGLLKGLSFIGKVPIAARALEMIPQRLQQIGVGALINGGLDFLRADGLQRDANGEIQTSWLDPSTKIAKPLAEAGIPDRIALGIGGGVVGAIIGPMAIGIAGAANMARAGVVARMSEENIARIRQALGDAGISAGEIGDKYRMAKVFITNLRKVALPEGASGVMADQLSREQYIANEIRAGSANVASPSIATEVLHGGTGDLANSGFYVKPDAAVILPNAAVGKVPTVEAVKQAMQRVGKDEFQRMVESEISQRSADPLAQAAATEEIARRIISRPAGVKSAHELLTEFQGTAFADTPAHKAAMQYANDISGQLHAAADQGVPKEWVRDRMLRDQLFNPDGTPYKEVADLPAKPRLAPVQPGQKNPSPLGPERAQPESMDIPLGIKAAQDKINLSGQIEVDGRLLAGIFRSNPGGVNVVTDVVHDAALWAAQERLGVKLVVAKIERPRLSPAAVTSGMTAKEEAEMWGQEASRLGKGNPGISKTVGKNMAGVDMTEFVYRDANGNPVGRVSLVKDDINVVVKASERRKGIATKLYDAVKKEGIDVEALSAGSVRSAQGEAFAAGRKATGNVDYMIGRPEYNYPSADDQKIFTKLTNKITEKLKRAASEASKSVRAPKTTEALILHDGTPIRGGLNTSALVEKSRLQKPVVGSVPRGDLALQESGKFVRMELTDAKKLLIELPRDLSQEQFRSIGRAVDVMNFEEVTLRTANGKERVFQTPIGAVVQDHIAELHPPKSVGVSITPEMVAQYKREGVFAGQAVVLPDGSVGEMVGHGAGDLYKVKEALTGQEILVHKESMSILPSALSGEVRGSNLFASYLSDAERATLAKMRSAVAKGWAKPIEKYRDMEQFANSRGYMAESMRGGKVRLTKINEGGAEPISFKNLKSAVEWIRKDTAPMAELGSDEITRLLGPDRHIGFLGGGGPPPRMNELMPIDWKRMEATMATLRSDRGPGMFQNIMKPMLPLMRDLDARFGTQMYKAASNVQSQAVARANFEALWYHGLGGKLPDGVKPLGEIVEMAGRNANQELITDWREADAIGKAEIAQHMSPKELKAAEELGKWYDAMYPTMGIGAPFVENYMPRYREAIQSGNPQSFQDFVASMAGDAMKVPKGTDWVSDHIRNGFIDAYDKEAFRVATQYLRAGSKNRFVKQANDEAREMVRMIADKNPNLALPMANMLQAMGGYEFAEQRAMLQETFKSIAEKLGPATGAHTHASIAEKLTNWTTSLVYASTMGFRPSLALRNAKDIWMMSWPIYHGARFNEAIGYALTRAGREEAMAARAISNYGGAMLRADEEVQATLAKMPKEFQAIHEASTALYDSADEFTRAGTYFAAKFKAEEALQKFAKGIEKGGSSEAVVERLKKQAIRDAKLYLHGSEVQDEFFRRAAQDPDLAARYAGKTAADFTNFLYGRGMQAKWMRSIGGRLMGQFGSWSMWYYDYLGQITKQALKGENRVDAMGILARHAFLNAAILETGRRVLDVDLSRWASYGALFYSGGPGAQIAMGASTLMRGLGDVSSLNEDPMGQQRVNAGAQMIWNTMPAFVPFHSAFRDFSRMADSYDNTELLAATLGTRVTKDFQIRRKIQILTGDPAVHDEPFQSTAPALGTMLNNMASGQGQQPIDMRQTGAVMTTGLPEQPKPAPRQVQGQFQGQAVKNRIPSTMPKTMETPAPAEPKPFGGY